jgi:hypothetical protein
LTMLYRSRVGWLHLLPERRLEKLILWNLRFGGFFMLRISFEGS